MGYFPKFINKLRASYNRKGCKKNAGMWHFRLLWPPIIYDRLLMCCFGAVVTFHASSWLDPTTAQTMTCILGRFHTLQYVLLSKWFKWFKCFKRSKWFKWFKFNCSEIVNHVKTHSNPITRWSLLKSLYQLYHINSGVFLCLLSTSATLMFKNKQWPQIHSSLEIT